MTAPQDDTLDFNLFFNLKHFEAEKAQQKLKIWSISVYFSSKIAIRWNRLIFFEL